MTSWWTRLPPHGGGGRDLDAASLMTPISCENVDQR